MSQKMLFLLLAVSLGLNIGVIATTMIHRSTGPHGGPPPGLGRGENHQPGRTADPARLVEGHLRGMTQHLDLDADQQQAIRGILVRHAPELATLQGAVEEAGRRLADDYAAPNFDAGRFLKLTAEASVARSRLDSLSAEMLVAEAAVLTPGQRLKFSEVAPTIHSQPQQPPRESRHPGDGRPPREGEPPPR